MKRITILLLVASVIPIQLTAQNTQQAKNKAIRPDSVLNVPNNCSVIASNVQSPTVMHRDQSVLRRAVHSAPLCPLKVEIPLPTAAPGV